MNRRAFPFYPEAGRIRDAVLEFVGAVRIGEPDPVASARFERFRQALCALPQTPRSGAFSLTCARALDDSGTVEHREVRLSRHAFSVRCLEIPGSEQAGAQATIRYFYDLSIEGYLYNSGSLEDWAEGLHCGEAPRLWVHHLEATELEPMNWVVEGLEWPVGTMKQARPLVSPDLRKPA